MLSTYIVMKTKGIQNLKKMLQNRLPGHMHQQAVRDYVQLINCQQEEDKLQKKLAPYHKTLTQSPDEMINDEAVDILMASCQTLEKLVAVQKCIASNPWKAVEVRKKMVRVRTAGQVVHLLYMSPKTQKSYFVPNFNFANMHS